MTKLCTCKRLKIRQIVMDVLLTQSCFFNRDLASKERAADLHSQAIEDVYTGLTHDKECNIGDLIMADSPQLESPYCEHGADKRHVECAQCLNNGCTIKDRIVYDENGMETVVVNVVASATNDVTLHIPAYSLPTKLIVSPPIQVRCMDNTSNSMELKVPVPCKDCTDDLHDWRIWSRDEVVTCFVCAKCFWRMERREQPHEVVGGFMEIFQDDIKPPLKLNLN